MRVLFARTSQNGHVAPWFFICEVFQLQIDHTKKRRPSYDSLANTPMRIGRNTLPVCVRCSARAGAAGDITALNLRVRAAISPGDVPDCLA
jgi:hypothetical protein